MERYPFDRDYVDRLAGGDAEVQRHFSAYFGELLLIKLRGRLRSPQSVADVRQETFLRVLGALKKKDSLNKPESLGSFVNRVCDNVLFEFFRSGKATSQTNESTAEPMDPSRSVESELITDERTQLVKNVLSALPPQDRDLLRAVFLEERDKDQICKELHINRDYLRVRVHRALARFRSIFEDAQQNTRARRAAG
ncbi:MAG: sigma-70 family RNA polymerase sigma factor [Bryobacteraceae bacterium]